MQQCDNWNVKNNWICLKLGKVEIGAMGKKYFFVSTDVARDEADFVAMRAPEKMEKARAFEK